jgi:hypothetical protein
MMVVVALLKPPLTPASISSLSSPSRLLVVCKGRKGETREEQDAREKAGRERKLTKYS